MKKHLQTMYSKLYIKFQRRHLRQKVVKVLLLRISTDWKNIFKSWIKLYRQNLFTYTVTCIPERYCTDKRCNLLFSRYCCIVFFIFGVNIRCLSLCRTKCSQNSITKIGYCSLLPTFLPPIPVCVLLSSESSNKL